jgi:subfamily B ATP-binding cassette protein MsbA
MKDLKKLLSLLRPYKMNAYLSVITNALSVIFALFSYTMVIPFLRILFNPEKLVNHPVKFTLTASALQHNLFYFLSQIIKQHGAVSALVMVSIVIVIASFFKNGFLYMSKYLMAPMMNGVARDYQRKIFNKLIYLPLSFFSDERKGNILSRMTNDVNEVRMSIQHILTFLFTGPVAVIIYMAFLFYTSYKLTLFVLVFLPIMGYIIIRVSQSLKGSAYLGQQVQGEILNTTEEVVSGLRIVKSFNAHKKVKSRFAQITEKYFTIMNKVERRIWLASPMSEFLATIIIMVIMYFGGMLVLGQHSTLSSEAFIAYLVVFSQVIPPAKGTINAYYNVQKGLASVKRIEEILQSDARIKEIENPVPIKDFNDKIIYDNVSFHYDDDDKKILNNINIEIKKGQTIAIVGESGSGKSTLVDLMPRFFDVTKGKIVIDGHNINRLKIKDLRNLFGIVSQTSILFNDTIENNIAFGVDEYTEEQLIEASKIANAYEFIMAKPEGFKTNIGESGGKLSGGQRQRISIARAVLKNPPILILDEATSSLDTESEKLVQDALTKIMKGRTSIVVAHRLSTVKNADLIFVMQNGQIVEYGKHKQLIEKNGVYKRLVDLQMI